MYNRFDDKDKKPKAINPLVIIISAISVLLLLLGITFFSSRNFLNEEMIISEAVAKDIIHCYSVEGFYPENILYIEEQYGLGYDHDKFEIDYIYKGSNIMPEYNVKVKEK